MGFDPRFISLNAPYQPPLGSGAYSLDPAVTDVAGFRSPVASSMPPPPDVPVVPPIPYASPAVGMQGDSIDAGGGWNPAGANIPGLPGGSDPGYFAAFNNWLKGSGMVGSYDARTGIKTDGWGGMALGAAQGLAGAFLGMKQYGIAKQTLDQSKERFNQQYAAQRNITNSALEDRQRARVASNPNAYESVGSYMDRNRVV